MEIYQNSLGKAEDLNKVDIPFTPDVFFLFVSPTFTDIEVFVKNLQHAYKTSLILGCSTAGEILGDAVLDSSVTITAVKFEKTRLKVVDEDLSQHKSSFDAGHALSQRLQAKDLQHILIFSDGLNVNGAELVKGLQHNMPENISITGGLAGDGNDFGKTFVISGDSVSSNKITGLGFYGTELTIGFGSKGGWDSFGVERLVTKSTDNVLYELDGKPALNLYKSFLGEKAKELPSSGLLFPLSLRDEDNKTPVVRTILSVDEKEQSLTFAGNIPKGSYVRLMKANMDRLISGAEQSAQIGKNTTNGKNQLAFFISCVGRRLVLKQLVEEEVEAANKVLGENTFTTGFYSYGEIAPFDKFTPCSLHNQTMTITTFSE